MRKRPLERAPDLRLCLPPNGIRTRAAALEETPGTCRGVALNAFLLLSVGVAVHFVALRLPRGALWIGKMDWQDERDGSPRRLR